MWLFKGSIAPKRYNVSKSPCASGGAEFLWTVFAAEDSQADGDETRACSLFVCNKSALAKRIPDAAQREATLAAAREAIKRLASIRHPNVLHIKELIPESRAALAFVAEPVFLSLANVRKEFVGLNNEDISDAMRAHSLSSFDIAAGLLHVGKALEFLHNNGMVHGNVSPHTIFVTPQGRWKLGDFMFLQKVPPTGIPEFSCHTLENVSPASPVPLFPPSPSLYHCAPELKHAPHRYNDRADLWSLGALIFELFADHTVVQAGGSGARFQRTLNDWHGLAVTACELNGTVQRGIACIPQHMRPVLVRLLQPLPSNRPSIAEFLGSPYFDQEGPIRTLRIVEGLVEMGDIKEQSKILGELPLAVDALPKRVQRDMILPSVLQLSRNPKLAAFSLPVLLKVGGKLNQDEFARLVVPDLARHMGGSGPLGGQMGLQLARHSAALMAAGDVAFLHNHTVPMFARALESRVPQISVAALRELQPAMAVLQERFGPGKVATIVSATVMPRLSRLLVETDQAAVRVQGLMGLADLVNSGHVGQDAIGALVLPALRECGKADRSAATLMSLLGVLSCVAKVASLAQLTRSIVPMSVALCGEQQLNLSQFGVYMENIQAMMTRIRKLREEELAKAARSPVDSEPGGLESALPHVSQFVGSEARAQQAPSALLVAESAPRPVAQAAPPEKDLAMEALSSMAAARQASSLNGSFAAMNLTSGNDASTLLDGKLRPAQAEFRMFQAQPASQNTSILQPQPLAAASSVLQPRTAPASSMLQAGSMLTPTPLGKDAMLFAFPSQPSQDRQNHRQAGASAFDFLS